MTPRKPRTKKANTLKPLYHSIGWFCLKAGLVLALTLFIYLIYLDSKITSLFSGQKVSSGIQYHPSYFPR